MLDYVNRSNKKYYPHTILKEFEYKTKKSKMENLINDDFNPSSSDVSDNESENLTINLKMRQIVNNLLEVQSVF